MRAIAHADSSKSAAMSRNNAIPFRSAMNGSPTRRCKSISPQNGRPHDQARHAVSASLALLHRAQIRRAGCRSFDRTLRCLSAGLRDVMARERLYLFDTTLRDGAQTNGVDFTLADKLAVASMLDDLGIDYVEGGYPGANPTDTELFGKDRGFGTTFTDFGVTRRQAPSALHDP